MYSWVTLAIFTLLCDQSPKLFHFAKLKLHINNSLSSSNPQPLATTILFSVSMNLTPGGSEVKVSACSAGDLGLIPGLGRSPGEGNGNLAWRIPWTEEPGGLQRAHGVAKSWTQLSESLVLSTEILHIHGVIQYLSFGDWLISPSRFIHIVACMRIYFLFKAE